jgi:hypothetical protein
VLKIDSRSDGYVTQYEKDGTTYVHMFSPADLRMLDELFAERYWPYADGVVSSKVKAAAENAFKEAWGYFERSFSFRLRKLERKHNDLEICHGCKGPRFKSEYCPSGKPGCDI